MSCPRIAVVGATGVVGETIVRVLHERGFDGEIGLFASRVRDGIRATSAEALEPYDVVFFAGSEDASEQYAPAILQRGGVVIDNSASFRLNTDVPLVVPEVNGDALRSEHRLLPVGNCTAIILCVALAPVRDRAGLDNVQLATYQAVSGAGRAALEEFARGEGPIVANVVPKIGSFDGSSTSEERKIAEETRKILQLPDLRIDVTSVRVPVRTAHSEAVFFETQGDVTVDELAAALRGAPGIIFHDDAEIVTPREVEGSDDVHVARLRAGERPRRFQMWVVGDQLRKGAATNAVQLLERHLALRAKATA